MADLTNSSVNVVDPDSGEIGSIPQTQFAEAQAQGYTPATPEQVSQHFQEQKYGSVPQEIGAGLEGAASSVTFGLSTGLERRYGISGEDIQGRREANPGIRQVGEMAGLAGSALLGNEVGAANLLTRAGEGTAGLLGLGGEGATVLSRIGSAAVKGASENALFQLGDENSKLLSGDPTVNSQTAIANIGLAGLIGGGIGGTLGAASPLWDATVGPKFSKLLGGLQSKLGGIEGQTSEELNAASQNLGVEVPDMVKSAMSDNESLQSVYKDLRQSPSPAGTETAKTFDEFRKQLSNSIPEALGKSEADVDALSKLSPYQAGKSLGNSLADEFEQKVGPIAEKFEALKEKKGSVSLQPDQVIDDPANPYVKKVIPGDATQIADKLGQLAQSEKWASDSESAKILNQTIRRLNEQQTIGDLTKLSTRVQKENISFSTPPAITADVQKIVKVIRDAEGDATMRALNAEAPELVADHQAARQAWSEVSDLKEDLQANLNLKGGKYNSNQAFIKNIRETSDESAEKLLGKLTKTDNAKFSQILAEQFPQTAEAIKQHQLNEILQSASQKTAPGHFVNPNRFFKEVDSLSPELRNSLFSPDAQERLGNVRTFVDRLNEIDKDRNFSNTASTLTRHLKNIPGTALGFISMLTGHNPVASALLGGVANSIGRNAPDAIRLSMLKFMGSSAPLEAGGFKSMVDFIHHTIQGENLISKVTKNIFKGGVEVLPQSFLPSQKDLEKLDKKLGELQKDPSPLMQLGGSTGHYLPDQQTALAQTGSNAVNYLNSLRPSTDKQSPLDPKTVPTKIEQAAYDRALTIAQQPSVILKSIHDGTLTAQDLQHLQNLYPGLQQRFQQKVMDELTNAVAREAKISYPMKMSLSLFMGQPLDSTMTPQAIQAAQMSQMVSPSNHSMPPAKHSNAALGHLSESNQTPSQARESARAGS